MPSFNQAVFLEEAIRSVLGQGYPNLELVVMDGGSTDGSATIVERFAPHLASWVSERDRGQTDAINKGIRRTTGEIVAYLNSDDCYQPGALHAVGRYFQAHPEMDIGYGRQTIFLREEARLREVFCSPRFRFDRLLTFNFICQPSTFIRRTVFDRIGLFDEGLSYVMDYEFWLRAALSGVRFGRIPGAPLAATRLWANTKSARKSDDGLREDFTVLDRVFDSPKLPVELRRLRHKAKARALLVVAFGAYESGDCQKARSLLRDAFRIWPKARIRPEFLRVLGLSCLGPRGSRIARSSKWAVQRWLMTHTRNRQENSRHR